MTGLLLKDLINLKKQMRIYLLFVAFYLVLSITTKNNSMLGGIVVMFSAMLPITAMSYDERAKWDKYGLTMPVSRSEMVLSKYLLGLLSALVGLVLMLLLSLFTPNQLQENMLASFTLFGIGLFYSSVVLPILFRFGVEKGRTLMLICLFVPVGAIVLFSNTGISVPKNVIDLIPYLFPIIVIAALVFSVAVSIRIYNKKEF